MGGRAPWREPARGLEPADVTGSKAAVGSRFQQFDRAVIPRDRQQSRTVVDSHSIDKMARAALQRI